MREDLAPAARLLSPLEAWTGEQISDQICRHHRRRLGRIGWSRALDPATTDWATGEFPPRPGNTVDVLIDGVQALPAMVEALRGAKSHVHITGWYFTPSFALERGNGDPLVLRNLLAELAERLDVRLLAWAGAPLPLFRPSRGDVSRDARPAGRAYEDPLRPRRARSGRCTAITRRRSSSTTGSRSSAASTSRRSRAIASTRTSIRHAPHVGWHDACARIEGPAVADVAGHFRMRWHEVTGEQLPQPLPRRKPAGDVELQVVRTVPERIYDALPRGEFTILESYLRALRSAQRFIYIENQFLWSPEIEAVLHEKIADPPHHDFRLVLLLPSKPNSGADDTRGVLGHLIAADGEAGRVLACTLFARAGELADPIYVHAKIASSTTTGSRSVPPI